MAIKDFKDFTTDQLKKEIFRREKLKSKTKKKLHTLAVEFMNDIDYALTQFGEYTFSDKGPYEVMDIKSFKEKITQLSISEISMILTQVLDNYSNSEYSGSAVNTMIGELDSLTESDFEELLSSDSRFEY